MRLHRPLPAQSRPAHYVGCTRLHRGMSPGSIQHAAAAVVLVPSPEHGEKVGTAFRPNLSQLTEVFYFEGIIFTLKSHPHFLISQ